MNSHLMSVLCARQLSHLILFNFHHSPVGRYYYDLTDEETEMFNEFPKRFFKCGTWTSGGIPRPLSRSARLKLFPQ